MITFHRAKIEEVPEIKKLLHETWMSAYSGIYSPEAIETVTAQWHSPALLTKQIKNPKAFFGVAKIGKKIVGMCNALLKHKGRTIYIQRLHVSPGYQGQGIGSSLIKETVKAFPQAVKVELEVEVKNHKAIGFYQRYGFKEIGKKVFTVKNIRLPCLIMEKAIL